MNQNVFKVVKIAVSIASIGVTLLSNYVSKRELDDKITEKVAEAIAKSTENEA